MMLNAGSLISDESRPIVIAGGNGKVIAQNKRARRIFGAGMGKDCWDVVGKLEDARRMPCRRGCVLELLASGADTPQDTQFKVGNEQHHISCTPLNGMVVCMLSPINNEPSKFIPPLSSRETEILKLLADGETTSSAAEALGVCESTVRTHVERMRSKLCVNTRAAVVAAGFRLGYLD